MLQYHRERPRLIVEAIRPTHKISTRWPLMSLVTYLLERAPVYQLWQAPFAADKLAPLKGHNDLRQVRRVLDVGCGPGTNTPLFAHADYLGVDINPSYIESAGRKHNRTFVAADVRRYDFDSGKFDFILANSLFHHLNDADSSSILSRLASLLTTDGHVHILDLVAPGDRSIAQLLANCDRGKYARTLDKWRNLFEQRLHIVVFEPYPVNLMGATLWNMVYCKGRAKA
jgi:SAM-dependent methyltransferase